jgi:hypothetical protein
VRPGAAGLAVVVWLKLALPRRLPKPTPDRIDRYDCEHQQHAKHNHWNADDIQRRGSDLATGEAGTCDLHSSEYGCRYMLELGKPRSNYQTQAGDEKT